MPRSHPAYPPEFKKEAVRLWRSSGRPKTEIARELGCSVETIRGWAKQDDINEGCRDGLTSEEQSELARLRRENRTLREERDILKKAAAWFAKETGATP